MNISLEKEVVHLLLDLINAGVSRQPVWTYKKANEVLRKAITREEEVDSCKHDIQLYIGTSKQCTKCSCCLESQWLLSKYCPDCMKNDGLKVELKDGVCPQCSYGK